MAKQRYPLLRHVPTITVAPRQGTRSLQSSSQLGALPSLVEGELGYGCALADVGDVPCLSQLRPRGDRRRRRRQSWGVGPPHREQPRQPRGQRRQRPARAEGEAPHLRIPTESEALS